MSNAYLYTIDCNVVEMFLVSAKSLRKFTNEKIIVFTNSLENDKLELLKNEIDNLEIIEIGDRLNKFIKLKNTDIEWKLSVSAYGWLFVDLLDEYSKILLVDADTYFAKNPTKIFNIESKMTFSAVKEPIHGNTFKTRFEPHWKNNYNYTFIDHAKLLGMNILEYNEYVNSGVILIDLLLFREKEYFKKMIKWHKNNPERIFNDQDVLNAVAKGDIYFLSVNWNYTKATFGNLNVISTEKSFKEFGKDAIIIHYAGKTGKPFLKSSHESYPKRKEYLKMYKKIKAN